MWRVRGAELDLEMTGGESPRINVALHEVGPRNRPVEIVGVRGPVTGGSQRTREHFHASEVDLFTRNAVLVSEGGLEPPRP